MPEMESQGFIEFRKPIAQHLLHQQADVLVHDLAIFFEQAAINHFLGQGVLKLIFLFRLGRSPQQVEVFQLSKS